MGKTTLACTAPGRKLHLCFDPDGGASIRGRKDTTTIDLSAYPPEKVREFAKGIPIENLDKVIAQYDTIVVDSLTMIAEKTLRHGINTVKGATIERPSPGAYGTRNAYIFEIVRNMLEFTSKHGKHVIFIAHEDAPEKDDNGAVLQISLMLGGKIPNGVAVRINEFWYLGEDSKGKKRIAIRPVRQRKPMKTRMFKTGGEPEFMWNYDADTLTGDGIENWYNRWRDNNFEKIDLPK